MNDKDKEKNKYFETNNLNLATTLQTLKELPIEVLPISSTQVNFLFRKSKNLDSLIDGYWSGTLRVEPIAFFNELSNLKSRIYQELRQFKTDNDHF